MRLALMRLADEPFRPRPGLDVRHVKLRAQDGVPLYRLRVGDVRAVFALLEEEREALVLVVQKREVGYPRMLKTAMRRLR